jgi:hypothetical protein
MLYKKSQMNYCAWHVITAIVNYPLVILSVCYYKTPKLKCINVKSNGIKAEMCRPFPTFYGIQLVADHLLRHKGRHVGFCSYLLLVLTSGGDASSSPN